jgi:hypothetical protein
MAPSKFVASKHWARPAWERQHGKLACTCEAVLMSRAMRSGTAGRRAVS